MIVFIPFPFLIVSAFALFLNVGRPAQNVKIKPEILRGILSNPDSQHTVFETSYLSSRNMMECLLRLLRLGRVRSQPQRPAAYDPGASRRDNPLESLPAELIFQVAARLPPSSATLLSLCSHQLHVMLGQRSLRDLNQSDSRYNEQALLLQALDRDLSETLYCFVCNKLHVLRRRHEDRLGAEEMYRRVSESRCQRGDGTYNYGRTDTYHAGFRFEHVQMTMKLYRRGLLADAKAFLTRSAFLQPAFLPSYRGLYFFEPRFVNGNISVRTQSWIFNPGDQGVIMPMKYLTTVCAHLDGDQSYYTNPYHTVFRCKLEHLAAKQDSCEKCRSLIRCHYCSTEVYVEVKRLDDSKGSVLITTKWQLLGDGLSPSEAHWESHLEPNRLLWPYFPDDAPGSIQAGYEDQPGIKFDSLLTLTEAWKVLNEIS